jgi:hypothetical protein
LSCHGFRGLKEARTASELCRISRDAATLMVNQS